MPGDDFGATKGFFFSFFLEGNRTVGIEALQAKAISTFAVVDAFYCVWCCCCWSASRAGALSTRRVVSLQKSGKLQKSAYIRNGQADF